MAEKKSSSDFSDNGSLAVVAIDFGTSFTGYAFSYCHDYQKIYTSTSRQKFKRDRVPTTVLLNPDRSFHSIGFDAEDKYSRLTENEEHKDWHYFQRFKMALYMTEKLSRDVTINDSQGRPMSAMLIFTMVIQHLKECARDVIGDSIANIQDSDIKWVITVPAIWPDPAKQFMREAALQAGIAENQLKLVLEPEAASLFCKEQPVMRITKQSLKGETVQLSEGTKYILADLGGGTADMCVHEILADGNIRELYRATGGALGGSNVDIAFQQFFIKLIGAEVWLEFKIKYMDEYLHLMRMFETKKNSFRTQSMEDIILSLPNGLTETIIEHHDQNLCDIINESNYSNTISVNKRNKLTIDHTVMEEFFRPTVEGIVSLIKEILAETQDEDIQTLLMVGGFSESPYLGEIIKSQFTLEIMYDRCKETIKKSNHKEHSFTVIFPTEGSLAVLKGAVMMGYKPRIIVERKARFSYGFVYSIPFQEGIHPISLKHIYEGEEWCKNVFFKVITQGEVLTTGQVVKYSSNYLCKMKENKHKDQYTRLYKSTQHDPTYCTEEEEFSVVGEIVMEPPQGGWPDDCDVETQLIVGEAELTVKQFNMTTGELYQAKMDFL